MGVPTGAKLQTAAICNKGKDEDGFSKAIDW